ncbi:hypothetical protein K439DRAFT_1629778 [Ramaria rubella]|nr:hypothetical protein K439DRAFT_1629778 [Ramaria rubella]
MPTAFDIRQKNAAFNSNARAGKNPTKPSRAELATKRSPIGLWALGVILFVVFGGVVFEIVKLIFL